MMIEWLDVKYCLKCLRRLGLAKQDFGPRRDASQVSHDEAEPQGFEWEWSWDRPHAEGHQEVILHLRGVRRIGGHIDAADFDARLSTAGKMVALWEKRGTGAAFDLRYYADLPEPG